MSLDLQADLFGVVPAPPPAAPDGFRYQPELISPAEEAALAARIAALPFQPFDFHGHLGNRRVVSFGLRYDYGQQAVQAAEPLPGFLVELRARAAALAGVPAGEFTQALINEYAPGAGIGWHRDRPQFGLVAGVSLLSDAVLRFRRKAGDKWERKTAALAPRSAYLLSGPARHAWQHSITPAQQLRYSVTFRTRA
jgi:alkylated DNA repair dioxygenase AlkB